MGKNYFAVLIFSLVSIYTYGQCGDSNPPTITLNGSATVTVEACTGYTELGATASDVCDGDITGSIVIDATAVLPNTVGSYSVTYNVTDSDGNLAVQATRTVDVVDTTAPTITLAGASPQTIEIGRASCRERVFRAV